MAETMNLNIMTMTKEDFDKVPIYDRTNWVLEPFGALVIIPIDQLHESGYVMMDYVVCTKDEPIIRISAGSDVINIDGIGGYGIGNLLGQCSMKIKPNGWQIDCIPCGYLRLYANKPLTFEREIDLHISALELYAK